MAPKTQPRSDATTTLPVASRPPLGAVVSVVRGRAYPGRFRLARGTCRIGAGTDADMVIDDSAVSRKHVTLELAPEGVRVVDQQSRNGTFCGEQRLHEAVLAPGSTLRIGSTELRLDIDLEGMDAIAPSEPQSYGQLLGAAAETRRLFAKLARLEGSLVSVLIEGESGTGKELVARAIHEHSTVAPGPFVALNCGALDRSLAKSELFGHKRGSFTGATDTRIGVFEAADGGTLFLDEIGELPLDVQPMLLRALETGSVVRVGENQPRSVRVRLLSATNRDLTQEVAGGRFREDLFYRTTIVRLLLPPLRERSEDIELLARHFATREGVPDLPSHFVDDLRRRSFPGNVRELKNAVQAFIALGTASLPSAPIARDWTEVLRPLVDPTAPYAQQKERALEAFTQAYLEGLLKLTDFNQSQAARISGLERSYLGRLLAKHGIVKK